MKKIIIISACALLAISCKRIRENNVEGSYDGELYSVKTKYSPEGEVVEVDSTKSNVSFSVFSVSGVMTINSLDIEIPRKDLKYYKPYTFSETEGVLTTKTILELGPDELQFERTENTILTDDFVLIREMNYLGFK